MERLSTTLDSVAFSVSRRVASAVTTTDSATSPTVSLHVDARRLLDLQDEAFLDEALETAGGDFDPVIAAWQQWHGVVAAGIGGRGGPNVRAEIDHRDLRARNNGSARIRHQAADGARNRLRKYERGREREDRGALEQA